MRDHFRGYFRFTQEEIKNIWKTGIIVFDTNILLSIYRVSDESSLELLKLFESFQSRVWIPFQIVKEFTKNRPLIIADQSKLYKDYYNKNVKSIINILKDNNTAPFLSQESLDQAEKVFNKIDLELKQKAKDIWSLLEADPIFDRLERIIGINYGPSFDDKQLTSIFKDGEERFRKKIPPGYMDEKTKTGTEKFGDLIIWNEILEKAKKESKPILFVTNEKKEDWLLKRDEHTLGAHPELVQEMRKISNQDFIIYSLNSFIKYGSEFNAITLSPKTSNEIRSLDSDESFNDTFFVHINDVNMLPKGIEQFKIEINRINSELFEINHDLANQSQDRSYGYWNNLNETELKNKIDELSILEKRKSILQLKKDLLINKWSTVIEENPELNKII